MFMFGKVIIYDFLYIILIRLMYKGLANIGKKNQDQNTETRFKFIVD